MRARRVILAAVMTACGSPSPTPDEIDRKLVAEATPHLQAGDFEACVAVLADRAVTDRGLRLWLECAQPIGVVDRVCATWLRESPVSLPDDCDPKLARARALADEGKLAECAALLRGMPPTGAVRILLARCEPKP